MMRQELLIIASLYTSTLHSHKPSQSIWTSKRVVLVGSFNSPFAIAWWGHPSPSICLILKSLERILTSIPQPGFNLESSSMHHQRTGWLLQSGQVALVCTNGCMSDSSSPFRLAKTWTLSIEPGGNTRGGGSYKCWDILSYCYYRMDKTKLKTKTKWKGHQRMYDIFSKIFIDVTCKCAGTVKLWYARNTLKTSLQASKPC